MRIVEYYLKKLVLFGLVGVTLLAGCTPEPTPTEQPTPRPTITILNACDIVKESEIYRLMGEPMTVFDEAKPGQITSEFGFTSRCDYVGYDPVSDARLVLTIIQPQPGLDVPPIREIAERYIAGMQQAGLSQYEALTELGEAAFWLPETQTLTMFREDGTGVIVSVEPVSENARDVAYQVVAYVLSELND